MFSIKGALKKVMPAFSRHEPIRDYINVYPQELVGREHPALKSPQGFSRPVMMMVETVNSCTLDCVFCAYGSMKRPKAIMPLALFEKTLRDYQALGGGQLSLTPVVGEVFTDPLLYERLALVKDYPSIRGVSITTNLVGMKRYKEAQLRDILTRLNRIHVSVYGLDAEEHKSITRKDTFEVFRRELKRLFEALDDSSKLWVNFRLFRHRSEAELKNWLEQQLGFVPVHYFTYDYAKWSGHDSAPEHLPFDAQWSERAKGESFCTIPAVAAQVHCNGNVSICHCDDYECDPDLSLGNIEDLSLTEMFQSRKFSEFWKLRGDSMPAFCRNCGFYNPPQDREKLEKALDDPLTFVGG